MQMAIFKAHFGGVCYFGVDNRRWSVALYELGFASVVGKREHVLGALSLRPAERLRIS